MRRREERKTMNKVRFGHSLLGIDNGRAEPSELVQTREGLGRQFTPDSFDTVIEAKGAVAAKCFKNPMRGGCVQTPRTEALRSSERPHPDVQVGVEMCKGRTPATVAYTLRRHFAGPDTLSDKSGNNAFRPVI